MQKRLKTMQGDSVLLCEIKKGLTKDLKPRAIALFDRGYYHPAYHTIIRRLK